MGVTEAVTPPSPFDPPSLPPRKPGGGDAAITPADVRDGAAVALAVGVAGVLLGLLWAWLAPRAQYVSNGEAVFLRNTESEARIGADGTFFLLAAALGVLSAVGVFLWRRAGGVTLVIGLAVGSCFAALVGWRLGLWLGPSADLVTTARKAGKGVPFDAPLQLLAHGALLAWPMAAVLVHLGLTALWSPHDPEPVPEWAAAQYPPPHVHADPAAPEPPRG
ncbi:hypothetical protein O1W17_32310 [Streptomyces sp. H34-S5]|nr:MULTISPECIES: hypothetical protein [unclassified Streptomyces]MCY0942794.1 hypothetical protein [Streptomyces sp. H34-AA3]MCY0951060.1 hypothetical protein [Streptomyces sp. H27-S2]MCZ4086612.1 hypothetical protein [Streptomyces sp. H34-S5]